MFRIILIGPPGVGKGTQGALWEERFGIPLISTGNMLRSLARQDNDQGRRLSAVMEKGALIDDAFMIELVQTRLQQDDAASGYILDGFPRTIKQAQQLEEVGIVVDAVVHYTLEDSIIIERLSGRWMHAASGRTYHEVNNPPKVSGIDDETGEPLIRRDDDAPDVVAQRLAIYREKTQPLLDYYIEHENIRYVKVLCQGLTIQEIFNETTAHF